MRRCASPHRPQAIAAGQYTDTGPNPVADDTGLKVAVRVAGRDCAHTPVADVIGTFVNLSTPKPFRVPDAVLKKYWHVPTGAGAVTGTPILAFSTSPVMVTKPLPGVNALAATLADAADAKLTEKTRTTAGGGGTLHPPKDIPQGAVSGTVGAGFAPTVDPHDPVEHVVPANVAVPLNGPPMAVPAGTTGPSDPPVRTVVAAAVDVAAEQTAAAQRSADERFLAKGMSTPYTDPGRPGKPIRPDPGDATPRRPPSFPTRAHTCLDRWPTPGAPSTPQEWVYRPTVQASTSMFSGASSRP